MALTDDQIETIREEGERVYYHAWDTHRPGGCDREEVHRHEGRYYTFPSNDQPTGPFEALEQAIRSCTALHEISETTTEIASPLLDTDHIFDLLQFASHLGRDDAEDGFLVKINDREYEFRKPAALIPRGG